MEQPFSDNANIVLAKLFFIRFLNSLWSTGTETLFDTNSKLPTLLLNDVLNSVTASFDDVSLSSLSSTTFSAIGAMTGTAEILVITDSLSGDVVLAIVSGTFSDTVFCSLLSSM